MLLAVDPLALVDEKAVWVGVLAIAVPFAAVVFPHVAPVKLYPAHAAAFCWAGVERAAGRRTGSEFARRHVLAGGATLTSVEGCNQEWPKHQSQNQGDGKR